MKKGILYIVPTPIGNLEDITLRAIKVLRSVSLIGAEDTRNSGKLLKKYEIKTPMFSYHKFNERARVEKILNLLKNGEDVAIISDSGTPGISDPSNIIIKSAIENKIKVETLPGATAFVPAFVSSGFDTERFYFIGFLPDKKSQKDKILHKLKPIEDGLIFYEAPHRLEKFFNEIRKIFGNRKVVIAREISKIYETYDRITIDEYLKNPEIIVLKGEFVIIIEGAKPKNYENQELLKMLKDLIGKGESKKNAVKKVQEITGEPKNKIYNLSLQLKTSKNI
ncbi:MAG TPA: 16S rRNA (cytidine(1402)-2'-O)-methyltransferase [Candidatus Cloacimonetes bacterium]|nr:16S rRNA (cytidine(1402)-2'-O)-methyltransferase [Candidatus Cloacimonadota bacterium]